MEQRVTVVAKDGEAKVLTGNHFHTLKSESKGTYHTDNLYAFSAYMKNKKGKVFFDEDTVSAWPEGDNHSRSSVPVASCSILETGLLKRARKLADVTFNLESVEEVLMPFRNYLDDDGAKVLLSGRSLRAGKVTDISRSKDNAGNFHFNVKTESAGKDDWAPPEQFCIKVPVFRHLTDSVKLEFDFSVSYHTSGDGPVVVLSFKKFDMDDVVDIEKKAILERFLEKLGLPAFWGDFDVKHYDDSWKYQSNGQRG